MLRIHFTGEDLARTVVAGTPDPLWEVSISLHRLQRRDTSVVFGPWRSQVLPHIPPAVRLLSPLAPPKGYCLDFLTPPPSGESLAVQTHVLRSTPRTVVRAELDEFRRQNPGRRLPSWTTRLAAGESGVLNRLAQAATSYFDACLHPYWERIASAVTQDRMRRTALLAQGGWESVLAGLHPTARWRYPVLELDYPVDQDLHLQGRGLMLQPSFFCRYQPTSFFDPDLPPVLVYPIEHPAHWASPHASPAPDETVRPLKNLLGAVRARLLQSAGDGTATTSELARRVHTTVPNASRHLTALREAGLIDSRRHHNTTLHTLTPLGAALLNGRPARLPA
ncbi:winged helix-turn-helix domain-containing protein [Streptomyces crystallinus]|uniref:Winged helix-turn-helix domain-containing protein n=1 Tax=Streptomyces crystallinus TaxID=68191 RepID=A0ABN1FPF4_9ACTN